MRKVFFVLILVSVAIVVAIATPSFHVKPRTSGAKLAAHSGGSRGTIVSSPMSVPPSRISFPLVPSDLREQIEKAQKDLAQAIIDEGVDSGRLTRFYREYHDRSDDDRLLKDFPEQTARGFRKLHALLARATREAMAREGKGPAFFQAPASRAMSPAMVEHALYLERLPVSQETEDFVMKVAQAPGITDDDIHRVAKLCMNDGPCIEKAAYTWIKFNHLLSQNQLDLIRSYQNGT